MGNPMLYLMYGSDEFSRSEAVRSLRENIPPDVRHLNSATLDGRKLKIPDLSVACEAIPFLSERRVVVVHDALKSLKAGKARDELRAYLEHIPPTCDLVFVESEDIDKRSSLFSYLKKHGQIHEFLPRKGAELLHWITDHATRLELRIDRRAAQHLVDYVGNDTRTLVTELEKLASYAGRGGRVTTTEIDLLVQDQHEHNLFAWIDSLSLRKRGEALQGLRSLLNEGQAAPYILFMLARQVRILLATRELAAQRLRANDIASTLRLNPFIVKKALDQVRSFGPGELETLHDHILDMDYATKTGRIQADIALDMLVLQICPP